MPMVDPAKIRSALAQFTGTLEYHRWSGLFRRCVLTDGVLCMAEMCGAFWLMDLIASHQRPGLMEKCRGLQCWRLKSDGHGGAAATCDDGDGNVFASQEIPFTDFPFEAFEDGVARLYVSDQEVGGEALKVVLLPSEY